VTGGNTFDNGTDYWNWDSSVFVVKTTKKLKKRFTNTPIKKRLT
jgi:hypothetical protein